MEVFLWGFTVSPKACVNFPESREESHFLFGLSTIFFDRPDQKLVCDVKVTLMVGADLRADRAGLLRQTGDVPSHPVAFASCTHQLAFFDGPVSPGVGNA